MGQPIRIVDLARDLIRLSSPAGAKDIQIAFTGLRPGEKLEESLFGVDEEALETAEPFLLIARRSQGDVFRGVSTKAPELEARAASGDDAWLRDCLTQLQSLKQVV
jgi:FlaA1/EpsC-like NDP-sugar epimerase